MRNLAGVEDCDIVIREELEKAGITIYKQERSTDEVSFSLYGVLGGRPLNERDQEYMDRRGFPATFAADGMASFVFTRQWYYWGGRLCSSTYCRRNVCQSQWRIGYQSCRSLCLSAAFRMVNSS